jgi:hypothetical protein
VQLLTSSASFVSLTTTVLGRAGFLIAYSHGHEGCGHSLVADEARRWSQLHRQQQQLLQAQQSRAAEAVAPADSRFGAAEVATQQHSSSSSGRPTPRLLAATETVPIRIWVEYQGIDSLSADGKQHLQDVVKISLGVLQKFYKVRNCFALTSQQ